MNSLDLHFGLGDAKSADEITIFWPSGIRQAIGNVPSGQVFEITEPPQPQARVSAVVLFDRRNLSYDCLYTISHPAARNAKL